MNCREYTAYATRKRVGSAGADWEKKILRTNTESFSTWTVYTTTTQGQTLSIVYCVDKN